MAPQPYTCNARLTLTLAVDGLSHKIDFPCQSSGALTPPVALATWVVAPPTILASAAAQMVWDLIRPLYHTTVPPPPWILATRSGTVFVPVDGGVLTGSGSNAAVNLAAGQATWTFKTGPNHKFKLVMMESIITYPERFAIGTGGAAEVALAASFLTPGAGANVNDWLRSRGGEQVKRGTTVSVTINEKTRRARGV